MPGPSFVSSCIIGIDFNVLAQQDPDFAKVYGEKGGILDFRDAKAAQQLTKSLLKRDFGALLELPQDRLCPPVPVRYNYIRWVQDLLDTTSDNYADNYDPERQVVGLDIGVGASCIFPLLGCSSRAGWSFIGTEIDDKNIQYAQRNVGINKLDSRIRIIKRTKDDSLIPVDSLAITKLDFTMCNPPFYTSSEDMLASYSNKRQPPPAVCTGADVEMITEGGDVGFALRMIQESLELRTRVRWFTSMLGKLESLLVIVKRLRELCITNFAVACLRAGSKTRRWAVGWSFDDLRPKNDVARREMTIKEILPFPTEFHIPYRKNKVAVVSQINQTLNSLPLRWEFHTGLSQGIGFASENVWSRAARRRQKWLEGSEHNDRGSETAADPSHSAASGTTAPALVFRVSFTKDAVVLGWLRGYETVIWESFCGMLKRTVDQAT